MNASVYLKVLPSILIITIFFTYLIKIHFKKDLKAVFEEGGAIVALFFSILIFKYLIFQ